MTLLGKAISNQGMRLVNDQPWTIQRLLDWTTQFFKDKGLDGARLDAEVLLADCLGCPRIQLYTRFDEIVDDEHRTRFRDKVKRHALGEPVAYLVGHREFYSLDFTVNSNVLIPRPETEHLVIETLDRLEDRKSEPLTLCDVGTGSGILAICLAKYLPQAQVIAIDISPDALDVARENAKRHGVDLQIDFREGHLLNGVDIPFDAIVSNPPYVSRQEMDEVEPGVKDFEPNLALVGAGEDGGDTSRELLQQARQNLKPDGFLLLETSPMLANKLKNYATSEAGFGNAGVVKDLAGCDRVVWASK